MLIARSSCSFNPRVEKVTVLMISLIGSPRRIVIRTPVDAVVGVSDVFLLDGANRRALMVLCFNGFCMTRGFGSANATIVVGAEK